MATTTDVRTRQEQSAIAAGQPARPPDPYKEAERFRAERAEQADLQRRIRNYEQLSPREQFQTAQEAGLVPEGSKFVGGVRAGEGLSASDKARIERQTGVPVDGWGYYTPEQVEEMSSQGITISQRTREAHRQALERVRQQRLEQRAAQQAAQQATTPPATVNTRLKMSAYEPPTPTSWFDKVVSFFTGQGSGELARESRYLKASIPGYFTGMSEKEYRLQIETEALYRDLFRQEYGRYPTNNEYPTIRAGLPRAVSIGSIVPGVVTAYRWDTLTPKQKLDAIVGDITQAAFYGMMAVGLSYKPKTAPVVRYRVIDARGNLTNKTVRVPVVTQETAATKFAAKNPAWVKARVDPLKIYGELGEKPIKPVLSPEPLLASLDWKKLPESFRGGTRIPSGYIPPSHIPSRSVFPGGSFTTAKGTTIKLPPGLVQSDAMIPSGMEIWSRKGIEQAWTPFAHTGARILRNPVTGELRIIDTATGKVKRVPAGGNVSVGLAGSGAPPASTRTMTPEQVARLEGNLEPEPYIWYEETKAGVIPRISFLPKIKTISEAKTGKAAAHKAKTITSPADVLATTPAAKVGATTTPAAFSAVKPALTPAPKTAAKAQPAIQPAQQTALKTATGLATGMATTPPRTVTAMVPISAPIVLSGGGSKQVQKLTEQEKKTATAWPQGFGWWVVFQRGGRKYALFIHGQKAPVGIKQVKQGKGEAYRGIQRHRGPVVGKFNLPMGVVTAEVGEPEREPGKVGAISFTARRPRITPKRPRIS